MRFRMGVEEEFHVVDAETGLLVPEAPVLLDDLPSDRFTGEFQLGVIESQSGVHDSPAALRADLVGTRRTLDKVASQRGLTVVAAGTVPLVPTSSRGFGPDIRYTEMAGEYQALADEQLICGAQVHVDVPDRDTAVRAMPWLSPWLPVLLALSASSPFWQGADTGFASWRTMVWQRWPSAGPAGTYASAAEYDAAVDDLIRSGVISDAGMIYTDVRPSAHQKTLELRICDACPDVDTVVLVAALFRAMVVDACEAVARRAPLRPVTHEWLRAATWRAARSGLEGDLLDPTTLEPAPAHRVVCSMLKHLRPTLTAFGDWHSVAAATDALLASGSAARRLRTAAFDSSWRDIVGLLADLTHAAEDEYEPRPSAPITEANTCVA